MTTSVSVVRAEAQATGKEAHDHRLFPCLEDGLKSNEYGCQLLGKLQVSQFRDEPLFWHLNRFQTREAAEASKSGAGLVVEAEGKSWLFSFGRRNSAPKQGEPVASVGPLQLTSKKLPLAKSYEVVAYLAVMPPKTYTRVHTHPGPEAWYVLAGEQCLETPGGVMKARTGEGATAPPATPMQLTNNGSSVRRALFVVIHDAGQPWTTPTEEWKPSGACEQ
jgi:quercetin dioxygenase-like cupin family protein